MSKNTKEQVVSSQYIDPSHVFGDHSISTYDTIVTSVSTLPKYIQCAVVCMYVCVYVRVYVFCVLSDFPYVVTLCPCAALLRTAPCSPCAADYFRGTSLLW